MCAMLIGRCNKRNDDNCHINCSLCLDVISNQAGHTAIKPCSCAFFTVHDTCVPLFKYTCPRCGNSFGNIVPIPEPNHIQMCIAFLLSGRQCRARLLLESNMCKRHHKLWKDTIESR